MLLIDNDEMPIGLRHQLEESKQSRIKRSKITKDVRLVERNLFSFWACHNLIDLLFRLEEELRS